MSRFRRFVSLPLLKYDSKGKVRSLCGLHSDVVLLAVALIFQKGFLSIAQLENVFLLFVRSRMLLGFACGFRPVVMFLVFTIVTLCGLQWICLRCTDFGTSLCLLLLLSRFSLAVKHMSELRGKPLNVSREVFDAAKNLFNFVLL